MTPTAFFLALLLAPAAAAGTPVPSTGPAVSATSKPRPKVLTYDERQIKNAPVIAVPAGYGRYCSLSYASGGFAFDWAGRNDDPCAAMLATSPGGTIARAGLYSMSGDNNIVARCEDGASVLLYKRAGSAGLQQAFDENKSKKKCVFTVAPRQLPILGAPFAVNNSAVGFTNGFDFARGYSVQTNTGTYNRVNYKGHLVNYVDHHDGMDWTMPQGTPIKSVHKGVVLEARTRDVTHHCPKSASRQQQEVYVLHVVGTGVYAELFVSYYAHFHSIGVETGAIVSKGTELGKAGSTGCSSEPHLHLEITRMSNTATAHRRGLRVPATEDYDQTSMIDPYGFSWAATAGFDPWAWRAIGQNRGALSIALWANGQAPTRD